MIKRFFHWVAHNTWKQNLRDNADAVEHQRYHKRGRLLLFGKWQLSWETVLNEVSRAPIYWLGFEIERGSGDSYRDLGINTHFLWFSLYTTLNGFLPPWLGCPRYNKYNFNESHGREYGFNLSSESLSLRFFWGETPMCSGGAWWKWGIGFGRNVKQYGYRLTIDIPRIIFGRQEYLEGGGGSKVFENVEIRFPEGTYHITGTISIDRWWRSRWHWWPLKRELSRGHCKVVEPGGIPQPGKGENSWDCGDDASHGMSCPAGSVEQLIETIRKSVNRQRDKHGGGPRMYLDRKMRGEQVLHK